MRFTFFRFLFFLAYGYSAYSQEMLLISPFPVEAGWGYAMTVADFNRDGRSDLVVIAPGFKNAGKEKTGIISVYYGGKTGFAQKPDLLIEPGLPGHFDGISNCAAGDFDNDGFDDLAVSNPFYGEPQLDRGFVQIYRGSRKGLDQENPLIRKGSTAYGSYGSSLACADFNVDGIDDLVVGSRFAEMLEGRIYVYFGRENFSLEKPDITLAVENSQALYLEFQTDFNGDGMDDLVCRTNLHWNAGISQYHLFAGGRNPQSKPVRSFETDQFTPSLYLSGSRLFIGTKKSEAGLTCSAVRLDDRGISPLPWETAGLPIQLSGSSFAVVSQSGLPMVQLYETSGEEITKKLQLNLSHPPRPDFPVKMTKTVPDMKKLLVIPSSWNGRESLNIVRIR